MLAFVRCFRPLLDRRTKRRLWLASAGAVAVASIEAGGLVLVVPLVQLITTADSGTIPSSAHWLASRMTRPTPLAVAAVLGCIVFGAFIVKGIASLLYLRWNLAFILRSEAEMSTRLLRGYLAAPYAFHLGRNSADLQRTVHDNVRRVYEDALVGFVGGAADAILILAVATVLFVIEPIAAAGATLYFGLVAMGYQRLIHGRASAAGETIVQNVGDAYRVVQQSLGAIKVVQLRHSEDLFVEQLAAIKHSSARRMRTLLLLNQAPRYYLEIAMILGLGLMAGILYPLRPAPDATAVLSLFLAAGFRLLPSLNRVLVALAALRGSQSALEQIAGDLAIVEVRPDGVDPDSASATDTSRSEPATVRFSRVSFSYASGLPEVLQSVTFEIGPGESVAFVGTSGAGKSTLLDLLLGLLSPTAGGVDVDGRPLRDVRARWQRSIGYVPQDVVLLDDSVRSNVAFGTHAADVDDGRVWHALAMAQLTDAIRQLPDGLDTRLGERGARLSGGQRQRVGIARALYSSPSLLVLDEATSSLDSATEARITDTIDGFKRALTLVIVTHRLSTVRGCDRIYLLEAGRITAMGTYDDLVASNPHFAELTRLPSRAGGGTG